MYTKKIIEASVFNVEMTAFYETHMKVYTLMLTKTHLKKFRPSVPVNDNHC